MIGLGSYGVFIMFVLGMLCDNPKFSEEEKEQFFKYIVKEHNEYRRKHHHLDVFLGDDMSKLAREAVVPYAVYGYKNAQGFNYNQKPFLTSSKLNETLAKEIVADWYNTGANYDYDNEPTSDEADPFTRIIWMVMPKIGLAIYWRNDILYVAVSYSGETNTKGYRYYVNNVKKPLRA